MYQTALPTKRRRFTNLVSTDLMRRYCYSDESGAIREVYEDGEVRQLALYLWRMEKVLKRLARTSDSACIEYRAGSRTLFRISAEARSLWHVIRSVQEFSLELTSGRRLNPHLELGLRLARKWEPRLRWFTTMVGGLSIGEDYPRKVLRHIVKVIRRVCKSKRFRALVNNHARGARDAYESCGNYVLDILRTHARILVLRIDLYFESVAKPLSDTEEADMAFDKFMRNMSGSRIVDNVVGYIFIREDGLDRRVHYHGLVFVDGDEHRQGYNLTERLERFWVDDCVGSSLFASYKNCFDRVNEYEFSCLGLMHYQDDRMLMGLREALEYMCKDKVHVLVRKGKGKNLRKGQPPKVVVGGKRAGAPRKHGISLAIAEQVLFAEARPLD